MKLFRHAKHRLALKVECEDEAQVQRVIAVISALQQESTAGYFVGWDVRDAIAYEDQQESKRKRKKKRKT